MEKLSILQCMIKILANTNTITCCVHSLRVFPVRQYRKQKGELYSKTFTYTIPETISNEAVVIDDLSVLVFVSQADPTQAMKITKVEDMPRIINACKSSIKIE